VESEPLTAEELDALQSLFDDNDPGSWAAVTFSTQRRLIKQARLALDAGAREAELASIADDLADLYEAGVPPAASIAQTHIECLRKVLASPSAAAEGFRLMMRVECSALRAAGFSWAAGYIERLADAAGVRWRRENPQQEGSPDGS